MYLYVFIHARTRRCGLLGRCLPLRAAAPGDGQAGVGTGGQAGHSQAPSCLMDSLIRTQGFGLGLRVEGF